MLELKKISKIYQVGDFKQNALNNVSMCFRENEFVSILGPSGSGKTTLLNIIGGLDKYTSGDLIINEISTKKFKDNDWDTYRNHRVGFVFQSYNLIGHQNVLRNVELALTLSGVDKKTRRKKALEVLKKVGLEEHIYKKPNQMSGGQMQRVAIARALINNPDILLADEPTGALDSETSEQIMNLLKEIAKDKLVIMVTHNPELAEKYSTRIINLKDGKIINDSMPYDGDRKTKDTEEKRKKKTKKTSMSFITALSLSFNNLLTKKGRTLLTAFAGSIGIIGIALILSLSNGVNGFITRVQEDTLTSYPLSIEETFLDASSLMSSLSSENDNHNHDKNSVYSNDIMVNMIESFSSEAKTNNLKDFKKYLEENKELEKYVNDIKYSYNLNLQIYNTTDKNNIIQVNPTSLMNLFHQGEDSSSMNMMENNMLVFNELSNNKKLLESQYDVVAGHMPEKYNEVVLMVDKNNELVDYALYALGLKDQTKLMQMLQEIMQGKELKEESQTKYSYEDIMNTQLKLLINSDFYKKENGVWLDNRNNKEYINNKLENGLELKITGIIRPSEDSNISLVGGIGYSSQLTEYVIKEVNNAKVVKEQQSNPNINVFTGLEFTNLESYESNLIKMGNVDLESPSTINIYPKDFESKEKIEEIITEYNDKQTKKGNDTNVIEYTDYVGLLMSGVTTIVDVIGYVLIAFVSISLIVSSIMIGIITYISVLERTKEIGVLRAIGARKKDVSRVFNAETFIVGITAGLIGIGITILANLGINNIIKSLTDITVKAHLPISAAIILILISVILTVIAGLIPARVASKKDPVIALRTE